MRGGTSRGAPGCAILHVTSPNTKDTPMDPSIVDPETIVIRPMTIADYPQVYALWE